MNLAGFRRLISHLRKKEENNSPSHDDVSLYHPTAVTRTFFAKDIEPHYAQPVLQGTPFVRCHVADSIAKYQASIAMKEGLLSGTNRTDWYRNDIEETLSKHRKRLESLHQTEKAVGYFDEADFVNYMDDNGLLASAIQAHAYHQGIVLSPESFLFTILHGVGRYIFMKDSARIKTEDRTSLHIDLDYGVSPRETNVAVMTDKLMRETVSRDEFAKRIQNLLAPLTKYHLHQTPFNITMLGAFNARYEYRALAYACGVRRIDIDGAPEEWMALEMTVSRLKLMSELVELVPWLTAVEKVIARIVAYNENDPESRRWLHRIVQYEPICSAPSKVSGWIANLFPFLDEELRTDFHVEGSGNMYEVQSLDARPFSEAVVHCDVSETNESFDIKLVSGLVVTDSIEDKSSIHMYRPNFRYGIWTDARPY